MNDIYFTFFMPVPVVVFYVMALTGCLSTSPGLPEIYAISISNFGDLILKEIRVNYFTICVYTTVPPGEECGPTKGLSAAALAGRSGLLGNNNTISGDMDQFFQLALSSQQIIPPIALGAVSVFGLGLLYLGHLKLAEWKIRAEEEAKAPPAMYTRLVLSLSAALGLAAAVEANAATAALQFSTTLPSASPITVRAGTTLVVLQWLAFGFSAVFAVGIALIPIKGGPPKPPAPPAPPAAPPPIQILPPPAPPA